LAADFIMLKAVFNKQEEIIIIFASLKVTQGFKLDFIVVIACLGFIIGIIGIIVISY